MNRFAAVFVALLLAAAASAQPQITVEEGTVVLQAEEVRRQDQTAG